MIGQKLLSITAVIIFFIVSGKLIFNIPHSGAIVGFGSLFLIFLLWYFGLCHDFFGGGVVNFLNKIAPLAFLVMFFVVLCLGFLKVIPWFPEEEL